MIAFASSPQIRPFHEFIVVLTSVERKSCPCQLPPPFFFAASTVAAVDLLLLLSTFRLETRRHRWRRSTTPPRSGRRWSILQLIFCFGRLQRKGLQSRFVSMSVISEIGERLFLIFWFRCFSVWLSFGGFRTGNNPVLTWETDLTALATAFADPSFADVNMTGVLVWTQLVVSIDFANCLPTIFHLFDLTHVIHFRTVCSCKSAIAITATAKLDSCPIHEKFLSCFLHRFCKYKGSSRLHSKCISVANLAAPQREQT